MAKTKAKRGARGARKARGARPARARKPAKVAPIPPKYGSVTPSIVVHDAAGALAFYAKAFGAKELGRMPDPGGKILHAEIKIGDSIVMLNDEFPEMGSRSPRTIGGTASAIILYVKDVDRTYQQAIEAGARSIMPPQDMFWGDRTGSVLDPFGYTWDLATRREEVSPEEMKRRGEEFFKKMQIGKT